jgi:transposase
MRRDTEQKAVQDTCQSEGRRDTFRRVARHKGGAVAVFATARQLARLIYRMLRYGHDYVDIGEQAYESQFQIRRLSAITETARDLGYTLVPKIALS